MGDHERHIPSRDCPARGMRARALLALLLVLVLASLTPLARLSPPDPTWFAGFWDDGDYDDVILLLTSNLHFLDTTDRILLGLSDAVAENIVERPATIGEPRSYHPGPPRAPPVTS